MITLAIQPRLIARLASAVSFSAALAMAQTSAPPNAAVGFRIAGTVVNAITGNPLAQAKVRIQDARNPSNVQSTTSSNDGRFEFTRLPPAKYDLSAAKEGFVTASYLQHERYSTAIVTGAGLDTGHLVLRLSPFAVLSGKVLDEVGEPVRHAIVALYTEDRRMGFARIQKISGDVTDDLGSYEFSGLDEGTYFIAVSAKPWYALHHSTSQADTEKLPSSIDPSLDVAYPITYYKDATDADAALPIPVRAGDRFETDIHLNPLPALHVIFRLPDNEKYGPHMPMLSKPSFNDVETALPSTFTTVSPGVYEISGVAPGRYTVHMFTSTADGSTEESDVEMDLTENGQEVDSTKGEASGSIKASITISGENKLPEGLRVLLLDSNMRFAGNQWVSEKGEVEFQRVAPGRYELFAGTPDKSYSVMRIAMENKSIAGHFLDVKAGSSLTVSLTLMGGAATVEGFAKKNGKAAAAAMIVLVPKNPEANRELFRRDQSDLDGSFYLRDVIPGTYTVCAIEDGWDLDWSTLAVIKPYCEHASPVTVPAEGGKIHLQDALEVHPK
jgi:hypothetical protein